MFLAVAAECALLVPFAVVDAIFIAIKDAIFTGKLHFCQVLKLVIQPRRLLTNHAFYISFVKFARAACRSHT